jgi:hypothetical protein
MNNIIQPNLLNIVNSINKFKELYPNLSEDELKQKGVCDAFLRKIDSKLPLFDYTEKVVVINSKGFELLSGVYENSFIKFPSLIKFKLINDDTDTNVFNISLEDYPEDNQSLISIE